MDIGNIMMNTNNNLISGGQNLFGLKTKLKFGNSEITSVFAQQKGERKTISVKKGGQITNFEIKSSEYENRKHFFLAHFFRNQYNDALQNLPLIESKIQIQNLEVWVSQKINNPQNTFRNLIAFTDLGTSNTDFYNKNLSNISNAFIKIKTKNKHPDNQNITLFELLTNPIFAISIP